MGAPSWQQLLDAYEATIAAVEDALARDGVDLAVVGFTPPVQPPATPPTPAEVTRLEALQVRARRCGQQLQTTMAETAEDLDTSRRISHAARSYDRAGHLSR